MILYPAGLNGHAARRTDAQLNKTGKQESHHGKSSQISIVLARFLLLSMSLLCYRHQGSKHKLNSIHLPPPFI